MLHIFDLPGGCLAPPPGEVAADGVGLDSKNVTDMLERYWCFRIWFHQPRFHLLEEPATPPGAGEGVLSIAVERILEQSDNELSLPLPDGPSGEVSNNAGGIVRIDACRRPAAGVLILPA